MTPPPDVLAAFTPSLVNRIDRMREQVNVLLIGGGGREHALAMRLAASPRLGTLYATHTSNPGIAGLSRAVDVPVSIREIYRLQQFIEKQGVGLVVIGPEEPLAEGYADRLLSPRTLVFGPRSDAARLEADKAWAKQLMRAALIPTAEARVLSDPESARVYYESREADEPALARILEEAAKFRDPADRRRFVDQRVAASRELQHVYSQRRPDLPVIKATGLAKGKGVVVPATLAEALAAIDEIMVRRVYGDAGRQVVIEERLSGVEVSVLAITDGSTILVLPPCQDHKRLGDGDTGPNTGGMGAFCPSATLDEAMMARVEREVLVPAIDALRREGVAYTGVLYAGIMITHAGPKVLEFNVRFGDPECQPLMARLLSDLLELMLATCEGRLADYEPRWDDRPACCVVLASEGYPARPRTGVPITGIEKAEAMPGVTVCHSSTSRAPGGGLITSGGRVLSVTALGGDMAEARRRAYAACEAIQFQGKTYRTDVAAGV
jgi:phosphoribosylamine---glycine ligase